MKTYTASELAEIIKAHGKWLRQEDGGVQANLRYADLSNADLSYADLSNANLSNANLRYADLIYANLSYANLRSANLRSANLRSADLSYADLIYANLRSADLRSADLRSADLRSADLSYADLIYANLRSANLRSADLRSADLLCMGNMHNIKTIQADIWQIAYTSDTMQIGCQRHLISEWWKFSEEEISRMDSQALAWWKAWKPILRKIIKASPAEPTGYGVVAE